MISNNMEIFDNLLSVEEVNMIYKHIVYEKGFYFGEVDRKGLPPSGLVFNLDNEEKLFKDFFQLLQLKCDIDISSIQRAYVNMFLPSDRPYFHTDDNVNTCLFYINPLVNLDEGGETQFLIKNELVSVLPVPGRMIIFDGNILHRATSFRNIPRITLAIKMFKK